MLRLTLVLAFFVALVLGRECCMKGDSCWPTEEELNTFYQELDPSINRTLWWNGPDYPRVCGVPILSEGEQPLFGDGVDMEPLYTQETNSCFGSGRLFCNIAVRNAPHDKSNPAFIVWPTSVSQVQTSIQFANSHNLCVCIAGTGHDFLNRHSCENPGLFIRTALFNDISFNFEENTATIGSGATFSQVAEAASKYGLYVASGWATTVGIAGWSIGGGHGPLVPSSGLGVDNLVSVDIVLADGSFVTANATSYSDLFFALRGGGGSNWGVITSFTVRTHPQPDNGFTVATAVWAGSLCNQGLNHLHSLVNSHLEWSLTLDSKWGGLTFITPNFTSPLCPTWSLFSLYVYKGPQTDEDFTYNWNQKVSQGFILYQDVSEYSTWWNYVKQKALEPILDIGWLDSIPGEFVGGVPSVTVSREMVSNGTLGNFLSQKLIPEHKWGRQELYQDITGNIGSPQDPNTSINDGMRTSLYHFVFGVSDESVASEYYSLGRNSYFSESAYELPNWKDRYWGDNYNTLLSIKQKYDPNSLFWCRHCVGSE